MEVWLISHGSYSDYTVECAFTSRELAIAYIASLNGVTGEEQTHLIDISELPFPDYSHAYKQLPRHLKAVVENHEHKFVERLTLYDSVPVVAT